MTSQSPKIKFSVLRFVSGVSDHFERVIGVLAESLAGSPAGLPVALGGS